MNKYISGKELIELYNCSQLDLMSCINEGLPAYLGLKFKRVIDSEKLPNKPRFKDAADASSWLEVYSAMDREKIKNSCDLELKDLFEHYMSINDGIYRDEFSSCLGENEVFPDLVLKPLMEVESPYVPEGCVSINFDENPEIEDWAFEVSEVSKFFEERGLYVNVGANTNVENIIVVSEGHEGSKCCEGQKLGSEIDTIDRELECVSEWKAKYASSSRSERNRKIARLIDENFKNKPSYVKLGKYLADSGDSHEREACKSRGQRARNKK